MTLKTKSILLISSLSIILLALLWWLIFMATQTLPSQKKQLQDTTTSFQSTLYKLSNAKEYDDTLKFIKNNTALISSLFTNQKDALTLVKTFEKDAQKNNLQLKIKKLASGANEATSLKFNLDLTGSFINIYHFLNALEAYPYFININNININRAETSTNTKGVKNAPALVTTAIIVDVLIQK